jgi:phage FluMu protein Com
MLFTYRASPDKREKKKNRYCKQINKTSVMADDMTHEKKSAQKGREKTLTSKILSLL